MFDSIFKEFEVNLMKCDNIAESAYDIFKIRTGEVNILANQGYFTEAEVDDGAIYMEAASDFMEKIKAFFKKIIDAIKEFVAKLRDTIDAKRFAAKINAQCNEVKKELAKNAMLRAKLKGKKIPFFDGVKAYRAYSKYIATCATENKKLFSKEFSSLDEYIQAATVSNNKIDELIDINDITTLEDYTRMQVDLAYALNKCSELADGIAKVTELFHAELTQYVKEMEDLAKAEDDASKVHDIETETSKEVSRSKSFMSNYISKTKGSISKVFAEIHSAISSVGKKTDNTENTEDDAKIDS